MKPPTRTRAVKILDVIFILLGLGILVLLTTRYQMPFRLDDVLHMEWAREHSLWDAFHVQHGEIVRSLRPLFAITIWILTHTAGTESYFAWHVTLVASFLIGLAYTGLTARYISQKASSLYITVTIFWIAFLPILNVLFWYGDLTFSIELMFTTMAWYYGLRGLFESRIGLWVVGCLMGVCAVLSKEPAIAMVNAVFAGSFLLYYKDVRLEWRHRSTLVKSTAFLSYILFLAVCIKLYLASPTKSNRFFDVGLLSSEELSYYIGDRLRYYGELITALHARLLLLIPVYGILAYHTLIHFKDKRRQLVSLTVLLILITSSFITDQPLFILGAFIAAPIIAHFLSKSRSLLLLYLPFSFSMIAIFLGLLLTIMLVKTQLIEFAFCAVLVAGGCWGQLFGILAERYALPSPKRITVGLISLTAICLVGVMLIFGPKLLAKEELLREVQATRTNANDAIKWMAKHLPKESTVLLTAPSLYGPFKESDLTGLDDEFKSFAQYTFIQGFVRVYFRLLDRTDLRVAYLEDSTMLHRVLQASRHEPNMYLFLQSGRDWQRFHSSIYNKEPLTKGDTLLSGFAKGNYATEIWKLRL